MRITPEMVPLHEPIRFNIYNEFGKLLVSRGIIPYNQNQINKLLEKPCYTTPYAEEWESFDAPCTLSGIEELILRLEVAYTNFITDGYNLVPDIKGIADELIESLEHEADMMIGLIHLRADLNPAIFRTFQNTVLAVATAKRLKWGLGRIRSLANAGLTQNLSMYMLQLDLDKYEGDLSGYHRRSIREHPRQTGRMLMTMGVQDRSWIQMVAFHHERMDGSGYPYAHFGKDIPMEARLLTVVDRYASFISPREYREGDNGMKIMRRLMSKDQSQFDHNMGKALIAEIGIYPPGVIVKLASGEQAVVVQRTQERLAPLVKVVWQADGTPYEWTMERDTRDKDYKVVTVVPHKDGKNLNVKLFWGEETEDRSQPLFVEELPRMETVHDQGQQETELFGQEDSSS